MRPQVLICDDSGLARKQLARSLPQDWEVEINFATNGLEGVEAILSGKGEIVFLDLTMPELDGYGVLETLQKQGIKATVFVVSGDIQPEAVQRVKAFGAKDFLKKPAAPETIEQMLLDHQLYKQGGNETIGIEAASVEVRDCYQELANVAMGQAADLLARMLDVYVILPIPNVNVLEVAELHMALNAVAEQDTISAVCQGFIGAGIAGEALILFHDSSFKDLAKLMKYEGELTNTIELELLMDTANVLIGAFLSGFSEQIDTPFSQGHPTVLGQHRGIADLIHGNKKRWKKTLAIEINYTIEAHQVQCDLLLLFTEDSITTMNNKIQFLLD